MFFYKIRLMVKGPEKKIMKDSFVKCQWYVSVILLPCKLIKCKPVALETGLLLALHIN